MSLINTTYFVRDVYIPVSANPNLASPLSEAITRYEDEILKSLMGYKMLKDMKEAWDASQLTSEAIALPDKWDKLINGGEFTFTLDGEEVAEYWEGLRNTKKVSLISYYVYYMYRRENASSFSGIGETISVGENSRVVSPRSKMIYAWNNMVDLYGEANSYALDKHLNANASAYNFILANKANYPDWKFTPIEKLNIWGL